MQHAKNEEKQRQGKFAEETRQMVAMRDELKQRYCHDELTEDESGKLLYAYYNAKLLHYDNKEWTEEQTIEEVQKTWPLAAATITKVVKMFEESGKVRAPNSNPDGSNRE